MHLRILLLTLSLSITSLSHAQQPSAAPHTFTATDGRKLTATIVGKTDTVVTIRRAEDGQEFVLPLDRISAADQAFVKAWGTKAAATPAPLASPSKDEAKQALDDARRFTASGEYAKALERHEWFHANALKISPSMSGVRLSFALANWKRLGDKYPPALDSLKKLRDSSAKTLLSAAGTFDLFQEVRSFNRALLGHGNAGKEETIQLFKQLDESDPALTKRCFQVVKEDLMETNETELFVKHAGDLKSYLAQAVEHRADEAKGAKGRSYEAEHIQYLDKRLNELTAFMTQIAESKGDAALADELRAMTAQAITVSPPAKP